MSEQVKGISERAPEPPYMDFPEAWAFVRTTKLEDHHMRCSWRSGVLCDCNVLWAEYYKRKAARSEQALAALEAQKSNLERELERHASIEEKAHLQTIDERDAAEEALSQAYYLITGHSPEWSNLFGHQEALPETPLAVSGVVAVMLALEAIDGAQRCMRAEIAQKGQQVAALEARNGELKTALEFIASRERYTFAECTQAEEIIGAARAALKGAS